MKRSTFLNPHLNENIYKCLLKYSFLKSSNLKSSNLYSFYLSLLTKQKLLSHKRKQPTISLLLCLNLYNVKIILKSIKIINQITHFRNSRFSSLFI